MGKPTCANCKYFINYLYKKDTHLMSLNFGHCTARMRFGKIDLPHNNYCTKWEEKEEVSKQSIVKILNDIDKRLEELVLLFEE